MISSKKRDESNFIEKKTDKINKKNCTQIKKRKLIIKEKLK